MWETFNDTIDKQNSNEIKELLEKINKLTADENDLSYDEYKSLYESAEVKIWELNTKLKEYIVDDNMADKYKKLVESFVNWIVKPFSKIENADSLTQKKKIIDLNWLPVKANFNDTEFTIDQIVSIIPEQFIAKNWSVEYYTININWQKYILRIDTNKDSKTEELSVLPINSEDNDEKKLVDLIRAWEISNIFSDIEIDWSASLSNRESWLTWAAYWAVSWAATWGATWWLLASPTFIWIPAWAASGAAIWWVWWAVTWFSAWVLTDLDLTTERAVSVWLKSKLDNLKTWYK